MRLWGRLCLNYVASNGFQGASVEAMIPCSCAIDNCVMMVLSSLDHGCAGGNNREMVMFGVVSSWYGGAVLLTGIIIKENDSGGALLYYLQGVLLAL